MRTPQYAQHELRRRVQIKSLKQTSHFYELSLQILYFYCNRSKLLQNKSLKRISHSTSKYSLLKGEIFFRIE